MLTATRSAALGLLAAVSAALWALAVFDHMSAQDDRLDLAVAMCVTVSAVVAGFASRAAAQRDQLRETYERDRAAYTRAVLHHLSQPPGDGDGRDQPQPEHPRWYRRVPA